MQGEAHTPLQALTPVEQNVVVAVGLGAGGSLPAIAAELAIDLDELLRIIRRPHVARWIDTAAALERARIETLELYARAEARQTLAAVAQDRARDDETRYRAAIAILFPAPLRNSTAHAGPSHTPPLRWDSPRSDISRAPREAPAASATPSSWPASPRAASKEAALAPRLPRLSPPPGLGRSAGSGSHQAAHSALSLPPETSGEIAAPPPTAPSRTTGAVAPGQHDQSLPQPAVAPQQRLEAPEQQRQASQPHPAPPQQRSFSALTGPAGQALVATGQPAIAGAARGKLARHPSAPNGGKRNHRRLQPQRAGIARGRQTARAPPPAAPRARRVKRSCLAPHVHSSSPGRPHAHCPRSASSASARRCAVVRLAKTIPSTTPPTSFATWLSSAAICR